MGGSVCFCRGFGLGLGKKDNMLCYAMLQPAGGRDIRGAESSKRRGIVFLGASSLLSLA